MFGSVASNQLSLVSLSRLLDCRILFGKSSSGSACSECACAFAVKITFFPVILSEPLIPSVSLHTPGNQREKLLEGLIPCHSHNWKHIFRGFSLLL